MNDPTITAPGPIAASFFLNVYFSFRVCFSVVNVIPPIILKIMKGNVTFQIP